MILSCTSLHWLQGEEVQAVYRQAHALLRAGGVFCNLDWMPVEGGRELRVLADAYGHNHEEREATAGSPSWQDWWEAAARVPWLADAVQARERARERDTSRPAEFMPGIRWHEQALLAAGFRATAEVWRVFDSAAVVAVK
jgi:SAM-dependent methyltransferase